MINEDRLYQMIGAQLRAIRKESRHTQASIADIVGLKRTSVTNIELGRQRPGIYTLYRYCEYFGISIADLLPSIDSIPVKDLPPKAADALEKIRAVHR